MAKKMVACTIEYNGDASHLVRRVACKGRLERCCDGGVPPKEGWPKLRCRNVYAVRLTCLLCEQHRQRIISNHEELKRAEFKEEAGDSESGAGREDDDNDQGVISDR